MIRRTFKTLRQYIRTPAAWSAERFGDEIEDEITFHLSERTRDLMAHGLSQEEARKAALARFGDAARIAAECHVDAVGGLALWHRLHLAMTVALAVAVGTLWLGLQPSLTSLSEQLPTALASMVDNDWNGDVRGTILDDRGHAIPNAHVLIVVKTWPDGSYFQRAYTAISDPSGRFLVEDVHPLDELYEVQIAAVADHRVLKSAYLSQERGALAPVVFKLPPSQGFQLKLEARNGETLAGAEVLPHGRIEEDGATHVVYFDSAQQIIRRTDRDGHVDLPYFQPGDTATVMLRAPQGEWVSRDVVVPEHGKVATIRTLSKQTLPPKDS